MPNGGYTEWGQTAFSIANDYGIDPAVFGGLIEQESSWNPTASPGTSSAFGFTQLLKGTAADLGVNRLDPTQNLQGGAKYLSNLLNQFHGDYTKALAAYHDGPGAIGLHGGFDYAASVLNKAKKYVTDAGGGLLDKAGKFLSGDTGKLVEEGANMIVPGSGAVLEGLGITGSCDWFCQFKNWIVDSGFFKRLAIALLAFIFILAAFYMMKGDIIEKATKGLA